MVWPLESWQQFDTAGLEVLGQLDERTRRRIVAVVDAAKRLRAGDVYARIVITTRLE